MVDGTGTTIIPARDFNGMLFVEVTVKDASGEESLPFIKQADRPYEETHFGNSKSFIHAVEKALDFKENIVYFVEDDYYHRQDAPQLITEGLKVGDYITLYDHPDKYTKMYDYGEISKVLEIPLFTLEGNFSSNLDFASLILSVFEGTCSRKSESKFPAPNLKEINLSLKLDPPKFLVFLYLLNKIIEATPKIIIKNIQIKELFGKVFSVLKSLIEIVLPVNKTF